MMLDLAFIGLAILVSILMQVNRGIFFALSADVYASTGKCADPCSIRYGSADG